MTHRATRGCSVNCVWRADISSSYLKEEINNMSHRATRGASADCALRADISSSYLKEEINYMTHRHCNPHSSRAVHTLYNF